METLYLKFNSQEEAYEKLADFRKEFNEPDGETQEFWSLEGADFDEVGTIYKNTGETTTDDEGNEIPIFEKIDGFHLNVLCRTPEIANKIKEKLDEDNIITPSTPYRVFA